MSHPKDEDKSQLGLEATVPGISAESLRTARADTEADTDEDIHHDDDLVTSARVAEVRHADITAGTVTLSGERLGEALAREVIDRQLSQAGINVVNDYQFQHAEVAVVLDGFDPEQRVGYQFVSHSDADVVTDFDRASQDALSRLADRGEANILVIHDHETPTVDELIKVVEAFISGLGLTLAPKE